MKHTVLMVSFGIIGGCNVSPPKGDLDCALGSRMRIERASGVIYGNISTKIDIKGCSQSPMTLVFVGQDSRDLAVMRDRSIRDLTPVGFTARLDGYVVEDTPDKKIFLAITVDNIEQNGLKSP